MRKTESKAGMSDESNGEGRGFSSLELCVLLLDSESGSRPQEVRLDKYLTDVCSSLPVEVTRSQVKRLIALECVLVNGKPAKKAGALLVHRDRVRLEYQELLPRIEPVPSIEIPILHIDEQVIVINKPAGIAMHQGVGTGGKTVVNALAHHLTGFSDSEREGNPRLGVVHRIDKDTTGVVVLARSSEAMSVLSQQFAERTTGRHYQALVLGTPRGKRKIQQEPEGTITTQFGRHARERIKFSVLPEGGKLARTSWVTLEQLGYGCRVRLKLFTGRTHQIRVHMAYLNSPVLGDQLYGDFTALPPELQKVIQDFGRQALHAESLSFDHPGGQRCEFEAPLPADHLGLIEQFRMFGADGFSS